MIKTIFTKIKSKCSGTKAISLGILTLLIIGFASESKAQGASFWSQPQRIPEYHDFTEEPPYLITDMNRTVHAFNAQPLDLEDPETPKAIFYRQWTIENGWTYPNDVLYDMDGVGLNVVGVTSDQSGRVHLIAQKGSDIYYVQNQLALAQNAASWPAPVFVAGQTSSVGPGFEIVSAIGTDPAGNEIVIIFSGHQYGNGLYFTSSSDDGVTWTEPYPVYLTGDDQIIVTDPKLSVGESGLFHAVWSTFLDTGFGGPGFYANFDLQSRAWSEPMELDIPGIRTPSVVEIDDNIFVSYYHINVNGNWWRRSSDGGKTWSFPEQFSSRHVGTNGSVSFVVDSANVLHAFFGERIDDNNHGMWHLTFTGVTWAGTEALARGPQRKDKVGGNGFDPRSARAVVVNGNVVLVTWGTDGIAGTNGAWFSYKRFDVPELPAVELPGSPVVDTAGLTPTITAGGQQITDNTTHSISDLGLQTDPPKDTYDPQRAIFIGVVPVVLLLLGMILMHYFQSRKR